MKKTLALIMVLSAQIFASPCFACGNQDLTDLGKAYADLILRHICDTNPNIKTIVENSPLECIDLALSDNAEPICQDSTNRNILHLARTILYLLDNRYVQSENWKNIALDGLYITFNHYNNPTCSKYYLTVPICYLIAEVEANLCLDEGINFAPFYNAIILLNNSLVPSVQKWNMKKKASVPQACGIKISKASHHELSILETSTKLCSLARDYGETLSRIVCSQFLNTHNLDVIPVFKDDRYKIMTLMLGIINRNPIALWHASNHGSARAYFMRGFYTIQEDIFPYIELLRALVSADSDEQKEATCLASMSFLERKQEGGFKAQNKQKLEMSLQEAIEERKQRLIPSDDNDEDTEITYSELPKESFTHRAQSNIIIASNDITYFVHGAYCALAMRLGKCCSLKADNLVTNNLPINTLRNTIIQTSLPGFILTNIQKAASYFKQARTIAFQQYTTVHDNQPNIDDCSFSAALKRYHLIRLQKQLKRSLAYENALVLVYYAMAHHQSNIIDLVSDALNLSPEKCSSQLLIICNDLGYLDWKDLKNFLSFN